MKYRHILIILIQVSAFAAMSKPLDSRSYGMGGVGVSHSPLRTAMFHNPAVMSLNYKKNSAFKDVIEIQLPAVDVEAEKMEKIIADSNAFSKNLKALNRIADLNINLINENLRELKDVSKSLEGLRKVNFSRIEAGITTSFGQYTDFTSYAIGIQRHYDFMLIPSINKNEEDPETLMNKMKTGTNRIDSNIFLLFKEETDYNFSFSNPLKLSNSGQNRVHFGIGLKFQTTLIGSYFPDINNTDDNSKDVISNDMIGFYRERIKGAHKYNNINFDLGLVYEAHPLVNIGLMIKNLVPQSHKIEKKEDLELDYTITPQPILGISFVHSAINLNAEIDLYPKRNYENIEGTVGNIKDDIDDEQFIRVGFETSYTQLFSFRAGYKVNLYAPEGQKSSFAVGFGIKPISVIGLDFGAQIRDIDNVGAAFELNLRY